MTASIHVLDRVALLRTTLPSFRRGAAEFFANAGVSADDKTALRAELAEVRQHLRADYAARCEALPFFYSPPELIRSIIARVLADQPELNAHGFGRYRPTDKLQAMRDATLTDEHCRECERALEWLMLFTPTPTFNRTADSYTFKHEAERWLRASFDCDAYISNGMLIIAALHLGLRVKRVEHNGRGTPNAYLNLPNRRPGQINIQARRTGRVPRR
ncbi:MAG: hypothetical protein JNJ73_10725 [Hyphomonadaceae bacterium]|nr:hypothetical protein [Hyphomonadaceae bacterium]